jgi:hypothetical protein
MRLVSGLNEGKEVRSSFSEEKEAKRLCDFGARHALQA